MPASFVEEAAESPQAASPGSGPASASATESLAEEAQNPIADLISLPFQNNTTFGMGPKDNRTLNVLNIQPVLPFRLSDDFNLVTRTILPVISQPQLDDSQLNGIGDLNPSFFFVPKPKGAWTVGFGPTLLLPTASDADLGGGKWGAGPAGVAVFSKGPWVVGALANQIWSFAGDRKRSEVSAFLLQPFVNYNLSGGWYLVSSPIITANWQVDQDQWILPLGGGVGRLFRIGAQPVNASLQAYANVLKPEGFGDVTVRAQLQFLFPKGAR
ncbi:MAG: neuromedin U [Prochlorococcaceae cyanobacterium]